MVQIWNSDGGNWRFNRTAFYLSAKKLWASLHKIYIIFACLTSVQLVPFPWDLSIKTQPQSLFHDLHLFSVIATKLILFEEV